MRNITDTYSVEELFTEYIFSLIKQEKDFMVFPDNKQILIEDEVDEWNKIHGLTDVTERILYHCVYEKGQPIGYAIKDTNYLTSLLVPYDLIEMNYNHFIERLKWEFANKEN